MELRNVSLLNIFHENTDSERLATFRFWERGCKVGNDSSPTSQRIHFWNRSRLESEDQTVPAQMGTAVTF